MTMNISVKTGFIFICIVASSCIKKIKLSSEEYLNWIKEEGETHLVVKKKIDDVIYEAIYQPTEFLALKRFKETENLNKKLYDSVYTNKSGLKYFIFKIKIKNSNDVMKHNVFNHDDYARRVQYYSFNVKDDFKLVNSEDTLRCVMHVFERTYGLTPHITLSIAFPNANTTRYQSDEYLIFNDVVFGGGNVIMKFDKNKLNKIPELVIQ